MRYLSGEQFKHILYEKDLSTRENTYMIISYMTIQKKDYIIYASLHTQKYVAHYILR